MQFTVNKLSELTGISRKKVARCLETLEPAEVKRLSNREVRYYQSRDALPLLYEAPAAGLDLNAERARLAKQQADKIEMENAFRRGELIELEWIGRLIDTAITNVKTRLLAIPATLSPYLVGKTVTEIYSQTEDAIYEALTELSKIPFGEEAPKLAEGKPQNPGEG